MAYKIKSRKKVDVTSLAKHLRLTHSYLEQEAQIVYGSSYEQLTSKEQKEISMKVAKKYPFSLRSID